MKKSVRVGLVQMHCGPDPKKNLARAEKGIIKLASKGAHIVCLPELFRTSYFCQTEDKKNFRLAESIPGPTTDFLSQLAKKSGATLITSIFEKVKSGKYYNTAVVISPRGILGKYRKMHIPDDLAHYYGETFYFHPGDLGLRVFRTAQANIAVMICYDQWFPEGARICASKGAAILFYPTAIGAQYRNEAMNQAELEAWQIIQRSHSIANNVFVVAVNRVGKEQYINFWGSSFVSDPFGRIIAQASATEEADLLVELDMKLIPKIRKDWPLLKERRVKCRL